jgi:gag-polypeptide of LTR copia-type
VLPHVHGHDLLGHLDGSHAAPSDSTSSDFKIWFRQDQLLLAWLLSSISESIVSQIVHCKLLLSYGMSSLRFSSQFLACIMDLKMQLHSLQKGHLSMQSYLDQKRSIADRLRSTGSPVSDADLQLYIFHGLSMEYDSLIVSLNSKSEAVPFNELAGLLLTHEQRIQKYALINVNTSSASILSNISPLNTMPQANLVASTDCSILSDGALIVNFRHFLHPSMVFGVVRHHLTPLHQLLMSLIVQPVNYASRKGIPQIVAINSLLQPINLSLLGTVHHHLKRCLYNQTLLLLRRGTCIQVPQPM